MWIMIHIAAAPHRANPNDEINCDPAQRTP